MSSDPTTSLTGGDQVLTIGVGEEIFAVPVTRVQEILDLQHISQLPNAPAHVLGVINVRGEGIAVVDLRTVLNVLPTADGPTTRIVVLWIYSNGNRAVVALKADRVFEVTALDPGALTPLPQAKLLRWDQQMVVGIGRIGGAFVTALDLDKMFDTQLITRAETAGALQPSFQDVA